MPMRCPVIPESLLLESELRHLIIGKKSAVYRIVFRVDEVNQEVHILSIRHGARGDLALDDLF